MVKRANKGDIVLVRYFRDAEPDLDAERPAIVVFSPDGYLINASVFLMHGAVQYCEGLVFNDDPRETGPAKYWRWPE